MVKAELSDDMSAIDMITNGLKLLADDYLPAIGSTDLGRWAGQRQL